MKQVQDALARFCEVTEVAAADGRWCRLGVERQAGEWRVWELVGQEAFGPGVPRLLALCPDHGMAVDLMKKALLGWQRSGYRRPSKPSPLEGLSEHQPLVDALRSWRRTQADREQLRPYHIFYDAHLAELVRRRPASLAELAACPGFGPAKAAKYGEAVLAILAEFSGLTEAV